MSATPYPLGISPVFGGHNVTFVDSRPIFQYRPRKQRSSKFPRPLRWGVAAAKRVPIYTRGDYAFVQNAPMSRAEAFEVANTLNRLNDLPLLEPC